MKKRRELPPFMKLPYQFDIDRILEEFHGFSNYDSYIDLDSSRDSTLR